MKYQPRSNIPRNKTANIILYIHYCRPWMKTIGITLIGIIAGCIVASVVHHVLSCLGYLFETELRYVEEQILLIAIAWYVFIKLSSYEIIFLHGQLPQWYTIMLSSSISLIATDIYYLWT